jgi:hypothetical protein
MPTIDPSNDRIFADRKLELRRLFDLSVAKICGKVRIRAEPIDIVWGLDLDKPQKGCFKPPMTQIC